MTGAHEANLHQPITLSEEMPLEPDPDIIRGSIITRTNKAFGYESMRLGSQINGRSLMPARSGDAGANTPGSTNGSSSSSSSSSNNNISDADVGHRGQANSGGIVEKKHKNKGYAYSREQAKRFLSSISLFSPEEHQKQQQDPQASGSAGTRHFGETSPTARNADGGRAQGHSSLYAHESYHQHQHFKDNRDARPDFKARLGEGNYCTSAMNFKVLQNPMSHSTCAESTQRGGGGHVELSIMGNSDPSFLSPNRMNIESGARTNDALSPADISTKSMGASTSGGGANSGSHSLRFYQAHVEEQPIGFDEEPRKKKHQKFSIDWLIMILETRQTLSYANLLEPNHTLRCDTPTLIKSSGYQATDLDAFYFENVEQRAASMAGGFMGSILHPSRYDDVRPEEERLFEEKYPYLESLGFNLEHLRKMKQSMLKMADEVDIELSSIALAFVYYEKLVIRGYVVKDNRKLVAAICLLLAIKVNEPKEKQIAEITEELEDEFDVSEKAIKESEFAVFSKLEFSLFVPIHEFMPHYNLIVGLVGKSNSSKLPQTPPNTAPFYNVMDNGQSTSKAH
ncbi:hypothetical protein H4219_006226 [Mycoemilia scoparia]|uniref:Cyclin N-terminal domain-containing protein n=1 Tax=Mycoemilia scoparia TaxID=417184 RepID=A0A9W7ZPV7_9FUNG|nr:hypothetical protein H4219_006226 [Mycoemilia scoparia]